MRTGIILSAIALALGACAGEPVYKPPADQTVRDYVTAAQLEEIDEIRKGDRDTWQYVTDRYVIYRSRMDDYLLEFKGSCDRLTDNSALPPADVIHDHRNLRASDTFRGCIVEKLYAISNDQRVELRNLGHSPGQND
jgi:hypothetical protein